MFLEAKIIYIGNSFVFEENKKEAIISFFFSLYSGLSIEKIIYVCPCVCLCFVFVCVYIDIDIYTQSITDGKLYLQGNKIVYIHMNVIENFI